jgi:hypothetical protein
MLDTTIFKGDVRGYHLVNLFLHCLNTLLVFWLLRYLVHMGIGGTNTRTQNLLSQS